MKTKETAKAEKELRDNVRFLSRYYETLTEENFSEIYQYHFNETPCFDRAGFRSALDFFTTGSNLANAFGVSRDYANPYFNFKLTSCNYNGERPPVPRERKLNVITYEDRGELPQRYKIYTEDFQQLWDKNLRRRVVTTEPYHFIPFEADTQEFQLVVLQAENPEDFVAHIRGDYYANWMEELMKNMKSFFHSSKNQMKFSIADYPNFVNVGQPCIVRINEIYWRAVISELGSDGADNVQCLLVDHGQLVDVQRSCIFVIDKTFMALPMQAIQLRIDGLKSRVKKWATSAKDIINTDCGTSASTCYIKNKYADCLGVDLKHAGSDEFVSNILIRKKFAVEDTATSATKLASLQTIYYYPPCKAYADVLRKMNRDYVLDCVVKLAPESLTSASSEESVTDVNGGRQVNDAFAAVPSFKGDASKSNSSSVTSGVRSATRIRKRSTHPIVTPPPPPNMVDTPPGFALFPPQQVPPEPTVARPRRNSLEGWGEVDDAHVPNQKVKSQEEVFDFGLISRELSEAGDVTPRTYQRLTPVSLTYRTRLLQCSVTPDQSITLFVVDGTTGYFSVQDRIKFTTEIIDIINSSDIVELALKPTVKTFAHNNNLLTGGRLLCCEMWTTFKAVVHRCRIDDEQFLESFILLLKCGIESDDQKHNFENPQNP